MLLEGNEIFVACRFHEYDASGQNFHHGSGAVYYYRKDSAGRWNETQKIVPNHRTTNTTFGREMAYSDGILYVLMNDNRDSLGNVTNNLYNSLVIFEKDTAGQWQEMSRLTPKISSKNLSFSKFAIEDSVLVLASNGYGYDSSGQNLVPTAGALFTFKKRNRQWQQDGITTARYRQASGRFGNDVAMDLPYLLVGYANDSYDKNARDTLPGAGSAILYKLENGSWVRKQKVMASDRRFSANFGRQIELLYPYAMIHAPHAEAVSLQNPADTGLGAFYFFDFVVGADSVFQVKKQAPLSVQHDFFLDDMSLSPYQAAVGLGSSYDANNQNYEGAAGAVYVINRLPNGSWDNGVKLVAGDRFRYDGFGSAVALDDSLLLVGAYGEDSPSDSVKGYTLFKDGGSCYVFKTCDSVNDTSATICHGDSFDLGGQPFSEAGTYVLVDSASQCQSRVSLQLAVSLPIDVAVDYTNGILQVGQNAATYRWLDCQTGLAVDSGQRQDFSPRQNGNYRVAVFYENCWDTSTCFSVRDVGFFENRVHPTMAVYPNPVEDLLYFSSGLRRGGPLRYVLSDGLGRALKSGVADGDGIEMETFAKGVYFLKLIYSNKEVATIYKVVKQ